MMIVLTEENSKFKAFNREDEEMKKITVAIAALKLGVLIMNAQADMYDPAPINLPFQALLAAALAIEMLL